MFGNRVYRYCSVVFEKGGEIYYYRTSNKELGIGDMVVVPVGIYGEQGIGTIVEVKDYKKFEVPQPVRITKQIICKANKHSAKRVFRNNKAIARRIQRKIAKQKMQEDLEWIDRIEEFLAIWED